MEHGQDSIDYAIGMPNSDDEILIDALIYLTPTIDGDVARKALCYYYLEKDQQANELERIVQLCLMNCAEIGDILDEVFEDPNQFMKDAMNSKYSLDIPIGCEPLRNALMHVLTPLLEVTEDVESAFGGNGNIGQIILDFAMPLRMSNVRNLNLMDIVSQLVDLAGIRTHY